MCDGQSVANCSLKNYGMINKVILLGNVGSDPEIRSLPSGGRVANFSLATSESWKGEDGTRKERTEWHKVVVFQDSIVGVIEKYIKKGSKLYIEGSVKTRKYTDSNGADRYVTEVVVRGPSDRLKMLDNRSDSHSDSSSGDSSESNSGEPASTIDDDIPF